MLSNIRRNKNPLITWLNKIFMSNVVKLGSPGSKKVILLLSKQVGGVYWNQAQKNFTHPYTEYYWVSVTLWLGHSITLWPINPQLSKQPAMGLGQNQFFIWPLIKLNFKYFWQIFFQNLPILGGLAATCFYKWPILSFKLVQFSLQLKNLSKLTPFAVGSWNLPHKFHLYLMSFYVNPQSPLIYDPFCVPMMIFLLNLYIL